MGGERGIWSIFEKTRLWNLCVYIHTDANWRNATPLSIRPTCSGLSSFQLIATIADVGSCEASCVS